MDATISTTILPFTLEHIFDVVQLASSHAGWFVSPKELEVLLRHPNFYGWLAVTRPQDGKEHVVGSITLLCEQTDCWVGFVVVSIPFRRKGVGKALVHTALNFLRQRLVILRLLDTCYVFF